MLATVERTAQQGAVRIVATTPGLPDAAFGSEHAPSGAAKDAPH
jgi:hypothetical protein